MSCCGLLGGGWVGAEMEEEGGGWVGGWVGGLPFGSGGLALGRVFRGARKGERGGEEEEKGRRRGSLVFGLGGWGGGWVGRRMRRFECATVPDW